MPPGRRLWGLEDGGALLPGPWDIRCPQELLGGSWNLVSKVISTLIGVISNCKYSYLMYSLSYQSHDPTSMEGPFLMALEGS